MNSTSQSHTKMKEIVSLTINKDTFEVVYREPSFAMLLVNPPRPAPDHVWKEIWGMVDGELKCLETIVGSHQPAQYIKDQIQFPR